MSMTELEDKTLEENIRSAIRHTYAGDDAELIGVLALSWRRFRPGQDTPPFCFRYNGTGPHIAIDVRCLVLDTDASELAINVDSLWYTEATLRGSDPRQVAVPLDFDFNTAETLRLTSPLPDTIASMIISHAERSPDRFMHLIAERVDPDTFLGAVAHPVLRDCLQKLWKENRYAWQ